MNQDYEEQGANLMTLLDEEGNEHTFEVADTLEEGDEQYVALIPVFDDPAGMLEDSGELVILKTVEEDGGAFLEPIEDEAEFDRISDIFMKRLEDLYDFED